MRKILAILFTTVITVAMLCSTAMAGSYAPLYWDLELEIRKADSANVIKDGIIGENEYEKVEIDNDKLWINMNAGDNADTLKEVMADLEDLIPTIEFYFSWDETNGFNIAVRYKPLGWSNDYTPETAAGGEPFLGTTSGGLLLSVLSSKDIIPNGDNPDNTKNILYTGISQNSSTKDLLTFGYDGQKGLNDDYTPSNDDVAIVYDASTGYVVYEWSIALDNIFATTGAGGEIFMNLAICGGRGQSSQGWGGVQYFWNVNLGQWGFFFGQDNVLAQGDGEIKGRATVATLSDVAVNYVEPTPTPPAVAEDSNNDWMLYVIIIEAVVIVAILAYVLVKKKK